MAKQDAAGSATTKVESGAARTPRAPIQQTDVPGGPLDQALRVLTAIADNYAGRPTKPMNVAQAMAMSPTSGPFRMIAGAAAAYGLTVGGAWADEISVTPLGTRIVRPTTEGDDALAKREALLRPRVINEFLNRYNNNALPSDNIAQNVLSELGVPSGRTAEVLEMITTSATKLGVIRSWGGKRYVDLDAPPGGSSDAGSSGEPVAALTAIPQQPGAQPPQVSVGAAPLVSPVSPSVSMSPGIHINIEIHIGADASSETIE